MADFLIDEYEHQITCIDTGLGRPGLASCYVMINQGRAAIIETGIAKTVPRILQVLAEKGIGCDQVDYIITTHVHLDHAGGVGGLIEQLPNAQLIIHPRGARHMIDPSQLQAGAMAVYGEEKYRATYGELIPVPEHRVTIKEDNSSLDLQGRTLKFFDTPGHARHHFCVWDDESRGIFTGDTLGIVYRELCRDDEDFVMPSTTPVQFEPEKLKQSIDRLFAMQPNYFYLTHYGRVEAKSGLVEALKSQIDMYVDIGQGFAKEENRQTLISQSLVEKTLGLLAKYQSPLNTQQCKTLIEMDMAINAQGLDVWLTKAAKQAG